jgi:hypothetical protein
MGPRSSRWWRLLATLPFVAAASIVTAAWNGHLEPKRRPCAPQQLEQAPPPPEQSSPAHHDDLVYDPTELISV